MGAIINRKVHHGTGTATTKPLSSAKYTQMVFKMSASTTKTTFASHLHHESLISIDGPDASKFLQGQVTCDVATLEQASSLGAHCTHKGRAVFSFLAAAPNPNSIILRLPSTQVKLALDSLNKYIIFSKAKTLHRDNWLQLGVWGESAEDAILSVFTKAPQTTGEFIQINECLIIKHDTSRFECWIHPDQSALADKLTNLESIEVATDIDWQRIDIKNGIGHVLPETAELFIPQTMNYHCLGGISFTKGCYTGQEVVARMQYHGKLKRHLYRVQHLEPGAIPTAGAPLYSKGKTQSVGNVVSAIATPDKNAFEALVITTDQSIVDNDLYLTPEGQSKLAALPLPYSHSE